MANKKILMVEDEETLREMYKLKFEAAGYNFIGVPTGEEGITLAEKESPDLMLIDLMLKNKIDGGNIDGFGVIEELKKDPKTKNIPMYALTNLNQESDIDQVFKLGADGFFVKSDLTPQELIDNVERIFKGEKVGLKPVTSNQ
ncbi:MAG: response regulator [Patescibacteria group bacterium]|jgi:CheY-like chemotaxis protein